MTDEQLINEFQQIEDRLTKQLFQTKLKKLKSA
jgi:hypothetical protein